LFVKQKNTVNQHLFRLGEARGMVHERHLCLLVVESRMALSKLSNLATYI
jgi:hypothetical protein